MKAILLGTDQAVPISWAAFLACATVLFAAQPWTKDASRWTAEDVQHVLKASPWAQTGQAAFAKGLTDETVTSTSLPDGSSAGLPGSKARWDGGVGRPIGTDLPSVPVTIRWDSAAPVRAALLKAHDPMRPPDQRNYVIAILGLWPGEKAGAAAEDGDAAPKREDTGHIRQELMSAARLLRHGKKAIAPETVELDAASGTIRLSFPKADPITAEEKDVVFSTQFGPLYVVKRFRLKDMVYGGRLEL